MRWLDGITNSMDVSLSNLQKAWCPARGRKELDTKTNKTPGANVGILGHESNCCPPPVHGPSGLYLQLPPGGSRGTEGAQGHRKGLRFEKTQGVGAGAGGTGLGPGQWRPREEENRSWVTAREGSPWLWVVVLVRNVLKPASLRTFIQNRRKRISPAWLQDQPGIQGASTPPEPRAINRRCPGKKRRPRSPRSQRPAGSLQGWGQPTLPHALGQRTTQLRSKCKDSQC